MQQEIQSRQELSSFIVERINSGLSGEIVFTRAEEVAKIYLAGGRVLWAIASGQPETFQSLLLSQGLTSKEQLLDAIQNSRRQGRKDLNEILEDSGVEDPELRRGVILRHTRAAVDTLTSWETCHAKVVTRRVEREPECAFDAEIFFDLAPEPEAPADEESPFETFTTPVLAAEPPTAAGSLGVQELHEEAVAPPIELQTVEVVLPVEDSLPEEKASIETPAAVQAVVEALPTSKSAPAATVGVSGLRLDEKVAALLQALSREVPDISLSILIDGFTGMPLAGHGVTDAEQIDTASAFASAMARSAKKSASALNPSADEPEEVLVTLPGEYILVESLPQGSHLLYLYLKRSANLGLARVVARQRLSDLQALVA